MRQTSLLLTFFFPKIRKSYLNFTRIYTINIICVVYDIVESIVLMLNYILGVGCLGVPYASYI